MTAMMTKLPCKDGVSAQGNFQIMPVPHICGHATYMSFFVKFAGSNWSNKNVHASQVPISPHPHRRFETTHRSDIAVSYGSMEQLKDLPHFARELMSKATPQKRRRKKKHTQQHSSCLAQWFLLFLPQTSGFLGSFFTIDRYLCEKSQVLIIHRFLFTTKKMVKPHGGTT